MTPNIKQLEQYLLELRHEFPHCTDIQIVVETSKQDIDSFTKSINFHITENNVSMIEYKGEKTEQSTFTSFRNPNGIITLKQK